MTTNYEIAGSLTKATHWIAKEDWDVYGKANVTVGKHYPVKYIEKEDEYFVVDDEGILSMIYLVHRGVLITKQ